MISLEKENTDIEERIIAAANVCFLKYGLEKATMSRIAREAGISRTSLNYYFRNKNKLLRTFFCAFEDQAIPKLLYLLNDGRIPLAFKIESFVDDYIDLIGRFPMVPPFLITELNRDPGWIIDFFKERKAQFEKLEKQIAAGVAAGKIKPIKPEDLFVTVVGLCVFPILSKPLLLEFFFDQNEERILQFMDSRKKEIKRIIRFWMEPDSKTEQTRVDSE